MASIEAEHLEGQPAPMLSVGEEIGKRVQPFIPGTLSSSGEGRISTLSPKPYALCPMPYAICHMPYAICHMPYAICHIPIQYVKYLFNMTS